MMNRVATFLILLVSVVPALAEAPYAKFTTLADFAPLKATFKDVFERFGEAPEFKIRGGHFEHAVCYESSDSQAILVFYTDEEFGGREKRILGISVQGKNDEKYPCKVARLQGVSLSLGGLKLGLTQTQFRTIVGPGVEQTVPGTLKRFFEYTRPFTSEEKRTIGAIERPEFDVTHSVWGVFDRGLLVQYGMWKVETF
jgi:hypothetical protein